jgi:hypothetical protein
MASDETLVLDSKSEVRPLIAERFGPAGLGGLCLILLCAAVGSFAGNAIYDATAGSRSETPKSIAHRPSASYLMAIRSPPVDYAVVERASEDFYANLDQASVPSLLRQADQCWATYDAAPQWNQFDYCVGFDMVLRSHASPQQIEAHKSQSRYASLAERRTERFLVAKSEPLGGGLIVPRRITSIAASVPIGSF